jgi:hypothetical protein
MTVRGTFTQPVIKEGVVIRRLFPPIRHGLDTNPLPTSSFYGTCSLTAIHTYIDTHTTAEIKIKNVFDTTGTITI